MELIWIEPNAVKRVDWDALCDKYQASPFVYSTYLDAVSEQWGILWSNEQQAGIPVPFTIRMGVRCAITPTFLRYVEWVGSHADFNHVERALQQEFKVGTLNIRQLISDAEKKHFQELVPSNRHLNQQAKRSLKKAAVFELDNAWEPACLFALIERELTHKVPGIDAYSLPKLRQLIERHETLQIQQLNLRENGHWLGGIWYVSGCDRLIYLKGTCEPDAKKNGGMYRLIEHLVKQAEQDNKLMDFGGSNVENVRRFNLAFGARDVYYSQINWNRAPIWWNSLRALKQKLRN